MKWPTTPHILLVSALAGWLNSEQQHVLEYLHEENRVLREQPGTALVHQAARRIFPILDPRTISAHGHRLRPPESGEAVEDAASDRHLKPLSG